VKSRQSIARVPIKAVVEPSEMERVLVEGGNNRNDPPKKNLPPRGFGGIFAITVNGF